MKPPDLHIETERLLIRRFSIEDIESSYRMNLDPEVSRYTHDGGVVSKSEIERRIIEDVMGDYEKHGFGRMAVELKKNGQFIGFTGLKYLEDMDAVDLGFRFMREFWGHGYATESSRASLNYGFTELKLEEILAFVLPRNSGSIRVLEKLGFEYSTEVVMDEIIARKYIARR